MIDLKPDAQGNTVIVFMPRRPLTKRELTGLMHRLSDAARADCGPNQIPMLGHCLWSTTDEPEEWGTLGEVANRLMTTKEKYNAEDAAYARKMDRDILHD